MLHFSGIASSPYPVGGTVTTGDGEGRTETATDGTIHPRRYGRPSETGRGHRRAGRRYGRDRTCTRVYGKG